MKYDDSGQCEECGESVRDCDEIRRENYERREREGKTNR